MLRFYNSFLQFSFHMIMIWLWFCILLFIYYYYHLSLFLYYEDLNYPILIIRLLKYLKVQLHVNIL